MTSYTIHVICWWRHDADWRLVDQIWPPRSTSVLPGAIAILIFSQTDWYIDDDGGSDGADIRKHHCFLTAVVSTVNSGGRGCAEEVRLDDDDDDDDDDVDNDNDDDDDDNDDDDDDDDEAAPST